jgi:Xaa-Pro aminopeptidase
VVIDYGAVYRGYHSDETCTFFIERVESDLKAVYGLVKEAHDQAIAAVAVGRSCREIDLVARDLISQRGWGSHFTHGTGHGVGLDVHEAPRISFKSEQLLEAGMVLTIEPGIYLPGKWGIRIEDTIRVTRGKAEILTKVPKELTVLG